MAKKNRALKKKLGATTLKEPFQIGLRMES